MAVCVGTSGELKIPRIKIYYLQKLYFERQTFYSSFGFTASWEECSEIFHITSAP